MVDGTLSQSLEGHNQIYYFGGGYLHLSILSQVLCAELTSDWIEQIPNRNNAKALNLEEQREINTRCGRMIPSPSQAREAQA